MKIFTITLSVIIAVIAVAVIAAVFTVNIIAGSLLTFACLAILSSGVAILVNDKRKRATT